MGGHCPRVCSLPGSLNCCPVCVTSEVGTCRRVRVGLDSGSRELWSCSSVCNIITVQWQTSHIQQIFHKCCLNIQLETLDFNLQKNVALTIQSALLLWNCIKHHLKPQSKKSSSTWPWLGSQKCLCLNICPLVCEWEGEDPHLIETQENKLRFQKIEKLKRKWITMSLVKSFSRGLGPHTEQVKRQ